MANQRILYTEEMVGYGHPTKADTLNRALMIEHGEDGQHPLSGFQGSQYAADAEANDTYAITLDPAPAAYFDGMTVLFKANTANTGAATLNVNALGAKTIKKYHDQDLATGDIESGQIVVVVYDGTNFQMISDVANFESAWTDYSGISTITGWSSFTTKQLAYRKVGKTMFVYFYLDGTSDAATISFTLPYAYNRTPFLRIPIAYVVNNSTAVDNNTAYVGIATGTSTAYVHKSTDNPGWTTSGSKAATGLLIYDTEG